VKVWSVSYICIPKKIHCVALSTVIVDWFVVSVKLGTEALSCWQIGHVFVFSLSHSSDKQILCRKVMKSRPFSLNLWQFHVRKVPNIQIVSTLPSSSATFVTSVLMKITRSAPYSFWSSLTAFSPFRTSTSQTATFCNDKLPEELLILALYQILPYHCTVAWSEILSFLIICISDLQEL